MKTDFFCKKRIVALVVCICCIVFTLGAFFYAGMLKRAERWAVRKSFYFLVRESTHIEASAEFVGLQGGAAYLLSHQGREYVTYSVYLNEETGRTVQAVFNESDTQLLCVSIADIYFKTKREKAYKEEIKSAFKNLDGCMQFLNGIIDNLESGGTQESAKRLLFSLEKQFSYLASVYVKIFPKYSWVCKKGAKEISDLRADIVYTKDLRYLLCLFADAYVTLGKIFSL